MKLRFYLNSCYENTTSPISLYLKRFFYPKKLENCVGNIYSHVVEFEKIRISLRVIYCPTYNWLNREWFASFNRIQSHGGVNKHKCSEIILGKEFVWGVVQFQRASIHIFKHWIVLLICIYVREGHISNSTTSIFEGGRSYLNTGEIFVFIQNNFLN